MAQEVRTSLTSKTLLKGQLIYRLNFAAILNTPEAEFARLIADLERDPFVQKLLHPASAAQKILSKKRFPNARLSSSFYEIDEERVRGAAGQVDVQGLLSSHKGMTHLIKKIGQENFEKHFLYREGAESPEAAAQACGITVQDAQNLSSFLLDLSVQSEFAHPSSISPEGSLHYTLVARVSLDDGKPVIEYLSPHLARGRYMINRDRIPELKKSLSGDEKKKLKDILSRIDWINLRQDTLQKAINSWVMSQGSYLKSGEPSAQLPFTQKDLAAQLKLSRSTVSRALYGKSVLLPWRDEKPLKDLFLNKRETAILRIGEILSGLPEAERKRMSDEKLAELLKKKSGIKASRRSVNLYRRAIGSKK
ncbi:MAG: hypothetical protein A2901_02660 [Elusimicrobia bacterium RIFCSPLOWO2_01_FULL_54_10]|nr:MAG: hypothetical protein A2901_02660 [Elusimicrobia bacterium RIFCSPLOWO2_01_FULL_54_10]